MGYKKLILVLALGLCCGSAIALYDSVFRLSGISLVSEEGKSVSANLPLAVSNSKPGLYTMQGEYQFDGLTWRKLVLVSSNRITELRINGKEVLPERQYRRHASYGSPSVTVVDLSSVSHEGKNELSITAHASGKWKNLKYEPDLQDTRFLLPVLLLFMGVLLFVYIAVTSGKTVIFSRPQQAVLFVGGVAVVFLARLFLFSRETWDMEVAYFRWLQQIHDFGLSGALEKSISDYTPMYSYFLGILSPFHLPDVVTVKLFPVVFEFVAGISIVKILKNNGARTARVVGAFFAFMCLPDILSNASYWGQCDSVYTGLVLVSILYLIRDDLFAPSNVVAAMVMFGLAFAFKQQAVFIAPLFLLLVFKGKVRIWYLAIIPAVYFVSIIPALLSGADLVQLLTVYARQAIMFPGQLSFSMPNIYAWLPKWPGLALPGILITVMVVGASLLYMLRKKITLHSGNTVLVALFYSVAVPFFLPYMHERYYYMATALMLLYAAIKGRYWHLAALVSLSSFGSYLQYLFGAHIVPVWVLAFVMLYVLIRLTKVLINECALSAEQAGTVIQGRSGSGRE